MVNGGTQAAMQETSILSAHHATRILGSLEPREIVRAIESVVRDLMGPEVDVEVFAEHPDDASMVVRFGAQGDGPDPGPSAEASLPKGEDGERLVSLTPTGAGKLEIVRKLEGSEGPGGVLRFLIPPPAADRHRAVVDALMPVVAAALRNAQGFERTKRLTFTDDLTSLYNSRFMALYLERELKRCRRARSVLTLLFMDLDGFKSVNDTHGHLAGSKTLVEVGRVLESTVRDADVLIRYGGDEFVILFPETPLSGGLVIAERIRQVVERTVFLKSQGLAARVSASIGIASYPESADDARGLIASADRAMYEAKALGKNRVVASRPARPTDPQKRPPQP